MVRTVPQTVRRGAILLVLLASCMGTVPGPKKTWQVGTAKVRITPDVGGWMTGYGNRKSPSTGVAADLWLRVVAFRDPDGTTGAIAVAEILGFPPMLARSIREEARRRYGLRPESVILSATHTHTGPAMIERPSPMIFHGYDRAAMDSIRAYSGRLKTAVLDSIGKALETLEPADVSFGRGEAGYAMNRRFRMADGSYRIRDNPGGVTDRDVPVLAARRGNGRFKAIVFTYACHCTTLGGDFTRYHGDHGGVAMMELERANPGATALFVAGCGGDINPSPRKTLELATAHGMTLAREVTRVLQDGGMAPVRPDFSAKTTEIRLPLEPAPGREVLTKLAEDRNAYRSRHARRMLQLMDGPGLPGEVPYPITAWRLGKLRFVALSGEVTVGYALRLKRELGGDRTWVAAYANEVPCYIPTEKVLAEGGYEAGWNPDHGRTVAGGSMMFYGWPTPFAPGLENRIVGATKELFR